MYVLLLTKLKLTANQIVAAVAVAVYLHENKVLTINEYKQNYGIHHARSYKKSKLIRLGPYLQIEIIRVQCICIT